MLGMFINQTAHQRRIWRSLCRVWNKCV